MASRMKLETFLARTLVGWGGGPSVWDHAGEASPITTTIHITINRVMIHAQTAHLERAAQRRLDETDADVFRASYVREALAVDDGAGDEGPGD